MKSVKLLADKELRRQVIWWTIGIGFFLIPLIYAVIANDFESKLQAAIDAGLSVTGFAIIGIFIGGVVVFNVKIQSVEDVRENDKNIDNSFKTLKDKKTNIKQHQIPLAMEYINKQNELGQQAANESLTQTTITEIKNKLVVAQIKGKHKRVANLNAKIDNLKYNLMYDRKFKPLKYKDVLKNNEGLFNGDTSYRKRYVDNPTATNWWLKIFTTPLKFLTLAGSLLSGMVLGISWQALLLYYVSITITTGISSLIVYILVSNRVVNKTYSANINMIAYIDNMMIELDKPIVQDTEQGIVQDKTDFEQYLEKQMENPEFAKAYNELEEQEQDKIENKKMEETK